MAGDLVLEAPAAPAAPAGPAGGQRGSVFSPVAVGWRHALRCWRPLLAVLVVQLLLGLTVAVPFQARMGQRLEAHVKAGAEGVAFPYGVWDDAKRLEEPLLLGLPVVLFWVVGLAWLFGAVAAGGFLGTLATPGPASAGRFFGEGGRHFGKMLRCGLVFALAVMLVGRVVFEGWGAAVESSEKAAVSEETAWWGSRIREGVFLLCFLWFRVAADLARTDLVISGRRSAAWAFLRRFVFTVRHPLRCLVPPLLIGVPAFGLILALSPAMPSSAEHGWAALLGAFLLLQVGVLIRWTSRAALLGADVTILRRTAPADVS